MSTPIPLLHNGASPGHQQSPSTQTSHARPFQDAPNLPEDPVGEETVNAFHDETNESDRVEDGAEENGEERSEKMPWYRRPSPWWMLTLMPITAMTLAGVNPSLFQIYTGLVCKALRKSTTSNLYSVSTAVFGSGINSSYTLPFSGLEFSFSHTETAGALYGYDEDNCALDPVVQAAVSKLMTALSSISGILACITAASWASLSDRLGRRPILIIGSFGVIIGYSTITFVSFFADHLPGGYWFLLVGIAPFGLLGGTAITTAAVYAYITDCTPASARAHTLSLTLGLRFTGMAIGPTLCALLVRFTGTPVAAVMLVVAVHIAHVVLVLFVVPESLSAERKEENRRAWNGSRRMADTVEESDRPNRVRRVLSSFARNVFAFLRPLSVVAPAAVTLASGRVRTDWSLTFIALSAGLASLILASYTTMFQFGAATFSWSAVELGYWYSGIVAARALTLTLILPLIIRAYHYYTSTKAATPTNIDSSETTPLISTLSGDSSTVEPQSRPKSQHPRHSSAFDLAIAQASLALEVACYALVPILFAYWYAHMKPAYTVLTILASCGAGFGPAIQALAVDLYSARGGTETGRLFGVLGVVQATSSQILGPTVYGLTYANIVAIYPQGIFFVSAGAAGSALIALFLVKLPGPKKNATHEVENAT
ncbi:hypothetical protein M0805_009175 [Coniferiporia weirii]|nr:hypothetical protein M0805_009175 [Coniferiporia weirii]